MHPHPTTPTQTNLTMYACKLGNQALDKQVYTCMHEATCMTVHVQAHASAYSLCPSIHIYTCVSTCMYVLVHVHVHVIMRPQVYTHMCTYVHVHVGGQCTLRPPQASLLLGASGGRRGVCVCVCVQGLAQRPRTAHCTAQPRHSHCHIHWHDVHIRTWCSGVLREWQNMAEI